VANLIKTKILPQFCGQFYLIVFFGHKMVAFFSKNIFLATTSVNHSIKDVYIISLATLLKIGI